MPLIKGGTIPEFLRKKSIDHSSLPYGWFEPFLPRTITSLWTSYTNTKALLDNYGNEGELYPDYVSFTLDELRRHLGVYILHGLSPSPEVDMKFQTQSEYDINGNNFLNQCLGTSAVRKYKHFWRFFATQHPMWMPSTVDSPNWKIDSFLKWIIKLSTKACR